MTDKRDVNACWRVPLFGMIVFLMAVSFAEAKGNKKSEDFGKSTVIEVNKARGELHLKNGNLIQLSSETVIYGQGQKYGRRILRAGQMIQVHGTQIGEKINASRIDVYATSEFWKKLNQH